MSPRHDRVRPPIRLSRRAFLRGIGAVGAMSTPLGWIGRAEAFVSDRVAAYYTRMIFHENALGPSTAAVEAVEGVLSDLAQGIHRYPDFTYADLIEAILAYNGVSLEPDQVLLGAGSTGCLIAVADALTGPGRAVVTDWPIYKIFLNRVEQNGGRVIRVPQTPGRTIDYTGILDALAENPDARLVHLNVINNPVGTPMDRETFDPFAREVFARFPEVVILADDSDREYADPEVQAKLPRIAEYVAAGENVIHVQTFSHIFGLTGLRIGYAFVPSHLVSPLRSRAIFGAVSLPSAAAAHASLLDADAQIARAYAYNAEGRNFLYDAFAARGLSAIPSQGAYLLVDVERDSTVVFLSMMARRVLIRDAKEWGFSRMIRVNPGLPEENERFLAALDRVLSQRSSCLTLPEFLDTVEGKRAFVAARRLFPGFTLW